MLKINYFIGLFILLAACSKKIIPSTTVKETTNKPAVTESKDSISTKSIKEEPTNSILANAKAMIVIDANGNIITPANKLPLEANVNADYTRIARAFTPEQKANLNFRYKTIPPKIIYVSDVYTQKSSKGVYCVYKKRFWYWKKQDGLFYLDEVYYK